MHFEEHEQQRLGENRHERGNNQAEAAGKQERCADAVTEALRLIRPLILGDEGREAVAEVLRGAVRQSVNLHAGVNAAIAARPKLFTRLCTHRMPKFMMDC